MATISENERNKNRLSLHPIVFLTVVLAFLPVLLLTVKTIPIGSMYWDLYIYFDAANRIFNGQIPSVDFFTPVGPLGYWLFAAAIKIFPDAQPLLLVEWSLFIVSAPLMALLLFDVDRHNRLVAYGLLLPFLFFAILPFNIREFYILAGTDGFGIYNRQAAILLFILLASLLFVRSQRLLTALVASTMLALFLVKITGFSAGGLLCLVALFTGRIKLSSSLIAAAIFLLIIGMMEAYNGIIWAYLESIITLLQQNTLSILPQLASKFAQNFKILGVVLVLMILLLYLDRSLYLQRIAEVFKRPSIQSITRLLDNHIIWLGVVMVAGVLYESQNWGSQGFIYMWPVLLAIAVDDKISFPSLQWRFAIRAMAIAAFAAVFMMVAERTVRGWAGTIRNNPLVHENLKTVGAVNLRPYSLRRAELFRTLYPASRQTYEAMAAAEVLPSFALFSQFKYQIGYLLHIDDAITAIKKREQGKSERYESIFHISFTNPFPWLMDRQAPKYVAIGADPFRAVPTPDERVLNEIFNTDIALFPTCPVIFTNTFLLKIYKAGLSQHKRIALTPCYDAFIHPRFADN